MTTHVRSYMSIIQGLVADGVRAVGQETLEELLWGIVYASGNMFV